MRHLGFLIAAYGVASVLVIQRGARLVANGTAAQQWYVRSTGDADGSYQIVSKHNGLTLDVASDRPAKRTNVLVDTPEAAQAQKFYLVKR